jgi:hypothetical protein
MWNGLIYVPYLCSHVTKVSFVVLVVRGMTTDRGKRKYSEKILSACHFVHPNFHDENPVPVWAMGCLDPSLKIKRQFSFIWSGVCHADDLGYLIFSPHLDVEVDGTPEETVRSQLVTMWTNFAKTGWVVKRKLSGITDICLEHFLFKRVISETLVAKQIPVNHKQKYF